MRRADLILMYHDLAADGRNPPADRRPYVLPIGAFRRHLAAIKASGYAVRNVRDWARLPRTSSGAGVAGPCAPSLMITFDDGDKSNSTFALPMLREAGLNGTFFVTVGRIGDAGYMGWEDVRALHRAGMEIGSHTLTHRPPALLSEQELRYELTESKKQLEDRLGAAVHCISSPTGFFNPRMSELAQEAGYLALCCGRIALATDGDSLLALPRIPIKGSVTDVQFARILARSRWYLGSLRGRQMVRNGLKGLLGIEGYLKWRRRAFRLWRER